MKVNKWYLLATPDKRKKYKLRILSHPIFSYKSVPIVANELKNKYPKKKLLLLKRTCQICQEIK